MQQIIHLKENGLYLSVRVQPGAKRSSFDGVWNDTHIKIALQAPAVDGKANEALIDFLSENLKIKKKQIFIVTGQTSRCKVILIEVKEINERTELEKWLKQKLLTENK